MFHRVDHFHWSSNSRHWRRCCNVWMHDWTQRCCDSHLISRRWNVRARHLCLTTGHCTRSNCRRSHWKRHWVQRSQCVPWNWYRLGNGSDLSLEKWNSLSSPGRITRWKLGVVFDRIRVLHRSVGAETEEAPWRVGRSEFNEVPVSDCVRFNLDFVCYLQLFGCLLHASVVIAAIVV